MKWLSIIAAVVAVASFFDHDFVTAGAAFALFLVITEIRRRRLTRDRW